MFQPIEYNALNPRQQENYNFHKVAGRLADFGYNCLRLNDDWQGADFLAVHVNGIDVLRVQLKGRLGFNKKYIGKELHVAFPSNQVWYVYPHDTILPKVLARGDVELTKSWSIDGQYTWKSTPRWALELLEPFKV